jgi:hypothetical protein
MSEDVGTLKRIVSWGFAVGLLALFAVGWVLWSVSPVAFAIVVGSLIGGTGFVLSFLAYCELEDLGALPEQMGKQK